MVRAIPCRAVLLSCMAILGLFGNAWAQVVINEILYEPSSPSAADRFVELYNTGNVAVGLSGWQLKGSIRFQFPSYTLIAPGGYLVVAQDPQGLRYKTGSVCLGPFDGALAGSGLIVLQDPAGNVVDQVEYDLGFPWPTNTSGRSIELINPNLDNAKAGAWRVYRYGDPVSGVTQPWATPGTRNSVWQANAPPFVEMVCHSPAQPASGRQIIVTAKVIDADGVASVMLAYQSVLAGSYIPAWLPVSLDALVADPCTAMQRNPTFEDPANWVRLPMFDNGIEPDKAAADGIFTALIPGQPNRTLVRYRITATDASKDRLGVTVPYEDDDGLNFACWVYDGLPPYIADVHSARGTPGVYPPDQLQEVPVYFMVTRHQDLASCMAYDVNDQIPASSPATEAFNWECALVYEGQVYDHLRYRLNGGLDRYLLSGKRDMIVRFNRGHGFVARDILGNKYKQPWQVLNIGRMFDRLVDLPGHGQANLGLPEVVNWILFEQAGVSCPRSHWFHMRMVTGPDEAPDQYHGDFWGLFLATEPLDEGILYSSGLPDGNLYRLSPSLPEGQALLIHQGAGSVSDQSDYANLCSSLAAGSAIDGLLDQDRLLWCLVVSEAVRWSKDDAFLYFQPDPSGQSPYGRLVLIPCRTDLSWGPWAGDCSKGHLAGIWRVPDSMGIEFRNRLRQFRDLIWDPNVIEPLLDRLAAMIADISQADQDRWTNVPRWAQDAGHHAFTWSVHEKVADMKAFAFSGGKAWPSPDDGYVIPGGQAAVLDLIADQTEDAGHVPARPDVRYTGPEGFPVDSLAFIAVGPNEASNGIQWRIAEVCKDGLLASEWDAVWVAGPLSSNHVQVPGDGLKVGQTYRIRARAMDGLGRFSHWSAPLEFQTGPGLDHRISEGLRITEIMYHPPEEADAEFLELRNIGMDPLDLSGIRIIGGVEYTFDQFRLEPGQYILLVKDVGVFEKTYGTGLPVLGQYSGRLDNAGELIAIVDRFGQDILSVYYDSRWYPQTDGQGYSLVAADPALAAGDIWCTAEAWMPSAGVYGSPGQDEIGDLPGPETVVINEVLAHSHADASDWVELHNRSSRHVEIGGWFLSDSGSDLTKYQIPIGTVIPAGGYLVLYERSHFGNLSAPGCRVPFALSEAGERIYLSSGRAGRLTGYYHSVQFGASETGITFGMYARSDGKVDFVYLSAPTPGAANAYPKVGPVVINEIMYNPAGNSDAEYVELVNISNEPVKLYDSASRLGWRFVDNPDNPGISLTIIGQKDVTIGPGAYVLLVKDKIIFEAAYAGKVPPSIQILQWTGGRLNNAGECIQLAKAIDIDGQTTGWVLVDQVIYSDGSHPEGSDMWPSGADGLGLALARIDPKAYGNDPVNWKASPPSPGRPNP